MSVHITLPAWTPSQRFSIGDRLYVVDLTPKWWRNPIRWLRYKLRSRVTWTITAVDHDTGTITMDSTWRQ